MLRFKLWYEKVMINMDAYTSFASVYDMFMDNIPYGEWCAYLTSLLKEYGVEDGILLDLGCGTGSLTELLAQEGYDGFFRGYASDRNGEEGRVGTSDSVSSAGYAGV